MKITHAIEIVTPEQAHRYLHRNISNARRLDPERVARLAAILTAGDWETRTGWHHAAWLDADGNLRNGQHQCRAIYETGVAATVDVWRGCNVLPPLSLARRMQWNQVCPCDALERAL